MAQPPPFNGVSSQYYQTQQRQGWGPPNQPRGNRGPHSRPPVLPIPSGQPAPGGGIISPTGASYMTPGGYPPQLMYMQQPQVYHPQVRSVHTGYQPQQQFIPVQQFIRPQQGVYYSGQQFQQQQPQQQPPQQYIMAPSQQPMQQLSLGPAPGAAPPLRPRQRSAITIRDPDTNEDVTSEVLSSTPATTATSRSATPRLGTPSLEEVKDASAPVTVTIKNPKTMENVSLLSPGIKVEDPMKVEQEEEKVEEEKVEVAKESVVEEKVEEVEKDEEAAVCPQESSQAQEEEPEIEPDGEPEDGEWMVFQSKKKGKRLVAVEATAEESSSQGEEQVQDEVAKHEALQNAVPQIGEEEEAPPSSIEEGIESVSASAVAVTDKEEEISAGSELATDDEKIMGRNVPDSVKEGLDGSAMVTEPSVESSLESMTDSAKVAGMDSPVAMETEEGAETEEDQEEVTREGSNKENEVSEDQPSQEGPRISYKPGQWTPVDVEGQKRYDRDFLLQFQKLCRVKPHGLAKVDCVLEKMLSEQQLAIPGRPVGSGFSRSSSREDRRRGGGGGSGSGSTSGPDPLAPAWMRDGKAYSSRSKGSRPQKQAMKVIEMKTVEKLERSENAWVRMSERAKDDEGDADVLHDEVMRKARGILNKLTPEKFLPLCRQMTDLPINTEKRLTGVIDIVFEKAVTEPGFSVAYAVLCQHLAQLKVPVAEGSSAAVSFRKVLLTRCQKEFEMDKQALTLDQIKEKVEEIENEEERAAKKTVLEAEEFKARMRSLGNVRFIGELYKLGLLTEPIMHECIIKLLRSFDQESVECMCRLMTTVGRILDVEKAKERMDQYFGRIKKLIENKKIPSRVRFMLQDLADLRSNKWIPRREDNNPKTLTQIRKEVARDEIQAKMQLSQHSKKERESGSKGADRRRGSGAPAKGAPPQVEQSWQSTTSKSAKTQAQNQTVDAERFVIKDKSRSSDFRLGPTQKCWPSGSRGSSASSPNVNEQRKVAGRGRGGVTTAKEPLPSSPGRKSSTGGLSSKEKSQEQQAFLAQLPSLMQDGKKAAVTSSVSAGAKSRPSPSSTPECQTPEVPSSPVPAPEEEEEEVEATEEEIEKKTKNLVKEYCNVEDIKEATLCVEELRSPSKHSLVVQFAVESTLETSEKNRRLVAKLLKEFIDIKVIAVSDYIKGMREVLYMSEDMAIDIPLIWEYLGSGIGVVITCGQISMSQLEDMLQPVRKPFVQKIVMAIIRTSGQSVDFTLQQGLWNVCVISPLKEELSKGVSTENIVNWIDQNTARVHSEILFIRSLSTAVFSLAVNQGAEGWTCSSDQIKDRSTLVTRYVGEDSSRQCGVLEGASDLAAETGYSEGILDNLFKIALDLNLVVADVFRIWLSDVEKRWKDSESEALKQARTFVDLQFGQSPDQT
eukprot:m.2894 g.2894  ORF g.2894 m.2894 type:complete len:1405 (+) comp8958_c0_seq1:204-4418(+)